MPEKIKTVGVLGAGTMGLGIAQICAMSGYKVQLFDVHDGASQLALIQIKKNLKTGVEKGKVTSDEMKNALENVCVAERLHDLNSDLIIEAVLENLEIKQKLFCECAWHA